MVTYTEQGNQRSPDKLAGPPTAARFPALYRRRYAL